MRKMSAALLGGLMAMIVVSTSVSPALALGGCGPNMHRGWGGRCYWGGQNEGWCLKHTGHTAQRMPNGEMVCFR